MTTYRSAMTMSATTTKQDTWSREEERSFGEMPRRKNVFVKRTSVIGKIAWKRLYSRNEGTKTMRHDRTTCKEEVQCHEY
jgi:hypothetical protein